MGCMQSRVEQSWELQASSVPLKAGPEPNSNKILCHQAHGSVAEQPDDAVGLQVQTNEPCHWSRNLIQPRVQPDYAALSDLSVQHVLASHGATSLVLQGFWRSTPVAMKLMVCDGCPQRALTEGLLARSLAHPYICPTLDVRCCQLTTSLLGAAGSSSLNTADSLIVCTNASATHSCTLAPSQHINQHVCDLDQPEPRRTPETMPLPLTAAGSKAPASLAGLAAALSAPVTDVAPAPDCRPKPPAIVDYQSPCRQLQLQAAATGASVLNLSPTVALPWSATPHMAASKGKADIDCEGGPGKGASKLSWRTVLRHIGAQPGDHLTVIVMQQARLGNLSGAISQGVFNTSTPQAQDGQKRLAGLLASANEIAMGLEYLHASGVVHGDLKPANVLLQDCRVDARGFQCMLSDFGLSSLHSEDLPCRNSTQGTLPYMAPELLSRGVVSAAVDLYAFGICLWEIASGARAYAGATKGELVSCVLRGDRLPWLAREDGIMQFVKQVYLRCVMPQPTARPTATELVQVFSALERMVQQDPLVDNEPPGP